MPNLARPEKFLTTLQFVYFLRFQLLTWIFLIGFPYLAFQLVPTMFANMFDLSTRDNNIFSGLYVFLFSFLTFCLAWTAMLTTKITLFYGANRFGLRKGVQRFSKTVTQRRNFHYVFYCFTVFACYPMLSSLKIESAENEKFNVVCLTMTFLFIGCLIFFGLLHLADFIQKLLNYSEDAKRLSGFLSPFSWEYLEEVGKSEKFVVFLERIGFFRLNSELISRTPNWFGRGYVNYSIPPGNRRSVILPAHFIVVAFFLLFAVVYIFIGILGWYGIYQPALLYLLLYVILLSLLYAGIGFFFDGFRLPSVILTALFIFIWSSAFPPILSLFGLDRGLYHEYEVKKVPPDNTSIAYPSEILNKTIETRNKKPFAVLVAADGGGIQAAAWTATVLTGLEKECRATYGTDYQGECSKNIRLISSVSGGSVGAMYFLNGYNDAGDLPKDLDKIVDKAEMSSLDAVVWGLVYPDFLRTFSIPYIMSRGKALENKWEETDKDEQLNEQTLLEWSKNVKSGIRPAMIFNATIVETGERLMISTSGFDEAKATCNFDEAKRTCNLKEKKNTIGRRTFQDLFKNCERDNPNYDIKIATAARLSASFPIVTPAAHSNIKCKNEYQQSSKYNIVDGGYYDNYGISSLTEWLDEALTGSKEQGLLIPKILVIQIRANYVNKNEFSPIKADTGIFYQVYSPANALMNMRVAGQLAHAENEFQLLRDKWKEKKVDIETAIFEYKPEEDENPPLSWHLTKSEKDRLKENWNKVLSGRDDFQGLKKFKEFIDEKFIDKTPKPAGNN